MSSEMDPPSKPPRVPLRDFDPLPGRLDNLPLKAEERSQLDELNASSPQHFKQVLDATEPLPIGTQADLFRALARKNASVEIVAKLLGLAHGERSLVADWSFVIAGCGQQLAQLSEWAEDPRESWKARDRKGVSVLAHLSALHRGPLNSTLALSKDPEVTQRLGQLVAYLLQPSPAPEGRPWNRLALSLLRGLLRWRVADVVQLVRATALNAKGAASFQPQAGPLALQLAHAAVAAKLKNETDATGAKVLLQAWVGHPYRIWETDPRQWEFLQKLVAADVDVPVLIDVGVPAALLGIRGDELLLAEPLKPEPSSRRREEVRSVWAPEALVQHFVDGKAFPQLEFGNEELNWFQR